MGIIHGIFKFLFTTNTYPKSSKIRCSDLKVYLGSERETYTYQADVRTIGNTVSGGGTRTGSYTSLLLLISAINKSHNKETRTYKINVIKYADIKNKMIDREFCITISDVRFGYGKTETIQSHLDKKDRNNLFINDVFVYNEAGEIVEKYIDLNLNCFSEAMFNTTPSERFIRTCVAGVINAIVLGVVCFIFALTFSIMSNKNKSSWERMDEAANKANDIKILKACEDPRGIDAQEFDSRLEHKYAKTLKQFGKDRADKEDVEYKKWFSKKCEKLIKDKSWF